MPERDPQLVRRVLEGDRDAYGSLVEHYGGLVHGVLLEVVRRPDEVEDLSQEVFCRAYEELASLRQPEMFSSWLCRIATRMGVDWLRQRKVEKQVALLGPGRVVSVDLRLPDEMLEAREAEELLWDALDRLPPEYRRLVVLYHLEGCPQQEIARFLGLSLATVKWRLHVARRTLRKRLEERVFAGAVQIPRSQRRLREKVLAGLPLLFMVQSEPAEGWVKRWAWRGLVGLACAGLLGLTGSAIWQQGERETGSLQAGEGMRVRRQEMELPGMSVLWEPGQPKAGQRLRVEAAGPELEGEGRSAELHYITDPRYPLDRTVPMRQEGDGWVAELEVPRGAASVFFYVNPAGEGPQEFDPWLNYHTWREKLQRYRWSTAVYDDAGRPVRGAAFAQAHWARVAGRPYAEVMAHWNQEIDRYPEHFEAYERRWGTMLWSAEQAADAKTRVVAEQQDLLSRFPNRPEVWWWIAQVPGMADSLISGSLVVEYDPQREQEQLFSAPGLGGLLPEGAAYSLRFDLFFREGQRTEALALARRLIDSGLRDPVPYLYIGQRLSGEESWSLLCDEPPVYPREVELGMEVLETGLRWTLPENVRDLPGFVSYGEWPAHTRAMTQRHYLERALGWRVRALRVLGRYYLDQGRALLAARYLKEAVEQQEQIRKVEWYGIDRDVPYLLGRACEQLGDWEGAENAYLRAVERVYSHPEAEEALARMYRALNGGLEELQRRLRALHPPAPDFALPDVQGEEVRLSGFGGSPVLLCYASAGERLGGRLEMLEEWDERFGREGLVIFYVGTDYRVQDASGNWFSTKDRLRELAAERGSAVKLLIDDHSVYDRYHPTDYCLLLIDRAGRLRLRQDRAGAGQEKEDRRLADKVEELLDEVPSRYYPPFE